MKTFRRILAITVGTIALTASLGAAPASAATAGCATPASIKGTVSNASVSYFTRTFNVSASVTTEGTGCLDGTYAYVMSVYNSNGDTVLTLDSRNVEQSYRGYGTSANLGSGTTSAVARSTDSFLVGVTAYQRSPLGPWSEVGGEAWSVLAPNDGFDSATGDDAGPFFGSCPATIRGSWC